MEHPWRLLGALAPGDQRLAERNGAWYLYDHSGATPDCTDDGPLRIGFTRPVNVYTDGCSVPVFVERDNSASRVMVTHAGMLRLRELLHPTKCRIIIGSEEVKALHSLFRVLWEEMG